VEEEKSLRFFCCFLLQLRYVVVGRGLGGDQAQPLPLNDRERRHENLVLKQSVEGLQGATKVFRDLAWWIQFFSPYKRPNGGERGYRNGRLSFLRRSGVPLLRTAGAQRRP